MSSLRKKHILQFIALYLILMTSGIIIISFTDFSLEFVSFFVLLTSMLVISLGVYFLIVLGMNKEPRSQGIYLLAGIGGKFLAYLLLILGFLIHGKNLTKDFIIAFFILYLVLTLLLIKILLKELKSNRL